jgi:hypothetical protein
MFAALILATVLQLGALVRANAARMAAPGDVVQLGATAPWPPVADTIPARLLAAPWAEPGAACKLDVTFMRHPGGLLTVLALRPDGVMLDWAGGPTAPGASGCDVQGGGVLIAEADYLALHASMRPRHGRAA